MTAAQTRDADATKNAILESAEVLFIETGFSGTSLSEIAANSGVTKSLIHHHFGSKEALWEEVKLHRFRNYAKIQSEMLADSEPRIDLLTESIEVYFRFLQSNPQMVRLMSMIHLEKDMKCLGEVQNLKSMGVEKIRLGQQAGFLRSDIDPRHIVLSFIGLATHWFTTRHEHVKLTPEDPDGLKADEAYLTDMRKIFMEGVLPR